MKKRYKLVRVRRGPPPKGLGWLCRFNEDYYDGVVRDVRRYIPLKDGGVMVLKPL